MQVVSEEEVGAFVHGDCAMGGCRPEYEYRSAEIKVSDKLQGEELRRTIWHEVRHLHYAAIDHAVSEWCAVYKDLLTPLAIQALIRGVDVQVNRAIEADLAILPPGIA